MLVIVFLVYLCLVILFNYFLYAMKKFYLLLFVPLFLVVGGCSTPKFWQGHLDCNLSSQDIAKEVLKILSEENFQVQSATDYLVIAQSETWTTLFYWWWVRWEFNINDGKIIATAYLYSKDQYQKVGYSLLGDDADEKYTNYWRVRRKIEKICNGTMVVIDKNTKKNEVVDDEFRK